MISDGKNKITDSGEINWRKVFNGFYEVSPTGLVRRTPSKNRRRVSSNRKLQIDKYGYERVMLVNKGNVKFATVHSLVAEAFIGPRPFGFGINHKDGNKRNNNFENLEYLSPGDNSRHASKANLLCNGEDHHLAKLTESQVSSIRSEYGPGVTGTALAKKYGVDHTLIYMIISRKIWKHVK